MLKVFVFTVLGQVFCELSRLEGWKYINVHCRDNDNKPVDWWYIYKPPSDNPVPIAESGKNFVYITPNSNGKWEQSTEYITSENMLKNTLSPLFRKTYSHHLAILTYHSKKGRDKYHGSYGQGIMLADLLGGFWLGHTVPGFPDYFTDRDYFPEDQVPYGHMFTCLSLDSVTLNGFAASLKLIQPNITRLEVPSSIKDHFPNWSSFFKRSKEKESHENSLMKMDFKTISKTVRGTLILRRPGDKRCLYKAFAKTSKIVLDVYGHDPHFNNTCKPEYSVRNINAISLKFPETRVSYINNQTDHVGFAVSTAAHWQRTGAKKEQYWVCTSSPEKVEVKEVRQGKGGLIVCIKDYDVWRSFDMLKVKEPEC